MNRETIGAYYSDGTFERGKTEQGECFKSYQAYNRDENETCYIPELSDVEYSHASFLEIAEGNEKLSRELFKAVDWQSPDSLLEEWMADAYDYIEDYEGMLEFENDEIKIVRGDGNND